MINILRYTEYIYLVVAFFSLYRLIGIWGTESDEIYLFLFFFVVSLGMFFFRRNFRRKFEKRNKEK
ncbi:hypothetical protein [Aureicoccus marinus]|jgi:hypothetical protein|uniref:Uncharacterized protein n=1 Tax=Aureicoccus marinus TaxID=754435 RepID=A0A2S7T9H1_9FLAO|nr:hypothetical protein [Aureicoccus marinus]PQJ16582.1 hypothetical protein BST99_13410 [Aureicoccus marinus]